MTAWDFKLKEVQMEGHRSIEAIIRNSYDLRIFTPQEQEAIVKKISAFFTIFPNKKMGNGIEPELLIFRDFEEQYWIADPIAKEWLKFNRNTWETTDKPTECMEGSSYLCTYLSDSDTPELELKEKKSNHTDVNNSSPSPEEKKQALKTIVTETFNNYLSGKLTSSSTESLLRQCILPDKNASFWTIGCRSGQWYCFTKDHWKRFNSEPDDVLLLPSQDLEYFNEKLNQTMELLCENEPFIVPEPIVQPWTPPGTLPLCITQARLTCTTCGSVLSDDAKFCPQCGRAPREEEKQCCSTCGKRLQEDARFCIACGTPVLEQKAPEKQIDAANAIKEILCPKCDAIIDDQQKFCASCGEKISTKPEKPTCPDCGAEVTQDQTFCVECGEELQSPH